LKKKLNETSPKRQLLRRQQNIHVKMDNLLIGFQEHMEKLILVINPSLLFIQENILLIIWKLKIKLHFNLQILVPIVVLSLAP